ncbi:MAG: flippase, partial [Paludibacteraceae bacterium]|nr:flippase [Paludibacteraceae bacterium]
SFLLSLAVSFVLFVGAPYLIDWFYTEEFSEAVGVLRVLAVSFPFLALWDVYGVNGLVLSGRETKYRQIVMWVSLAGFALSFPLVYYGSFMGVACLLLLVRATTGVWTYMSAKNQTRRA